MDLIFHIIELIVKAALDDNKPRQSPRPPVRPTQGYPMQRSQPPGGQPRSGQPSARPMAPLTQVAAPDPVYDGEGWRRALTVLAVIVFIVMVAAWFMYTQGWL